MCVKKKIIMDTAIRISVRLCPVTDKLSKPQKECGLHKTFNLASAKKHNVVKALLTHMPHSKTKESTIKYIPLAEDLNFT